MISRNESRYAEKRFGITLATWMDANDMPPEAAALARAVVAGLRHAMNMRKGLDNLMREHAADRVAAAAMLASGAEVTEDLPHRPDVAGSLKALANFEATLQPLVLALHEAVNEPHI